METPLTVHRVAEEHPPSRDVPARSPTRVGSPRLPVVSRCSLWKTRRSSCIGRGDTLNGSTGLRGKARRHEIELSDEAHALLLDVSQELEQIIERNRCTDPPKWAV